MKLLPLLLATLAALPLAGAIDGEPERGFPLRKKFPDLAAVSTEQFLAMDGALVIDTRTNAEFDVLHVAGAVNLPLEDMDRVALGLLLKQDKDQATVFYSDDFVCSKSYKAARKAQGWGLQNCSVYDSGIFEFAQAAPDQSVYFGQPIDQEQLNRVLLDKADLAKRSVGPKAFIEMMRSGKFRIYDVRDKRQRQDYPLRVAKTAKLGVEQFIDYLKKGVVPTQDILVLDNAGNQIKWLQYYLEHHGIEDYTLLEGGVTQWVRAGFNEDGKKAANGVKRPR